MIIKRIKISNYKTYQALDLDLGVSRDKPIVLIGGGNGGGKTTLFEAICGALYGLNLKNAKQFDLLLNDGGRGRLEPRIVLELTFEGIVLGRPYPYILRRQYELNPAGKVVENVRMNMNGNIFQYGTFTPAGERRLAQTEVAKIIKANLPQELSRYFLFDAMQSSELLRENAFTKTIRDNIENVMGFNKYIQLRRSAEHLLEEKTKSRMVAQEEREEYDKLCDDRRKLEEQQHAIAEEMEQAYRYIADMKEKYESAREGADIAKSNQSEITRINDQIEATAKQAESYAEAVAAYVQHMEKNAVVAQVADNLEAEVSRMLKQKELLRQEAEHIYSAAEIADIAKSVVGYLKDFYGMSQDIDINRLAEYIESRQNRVAPPDDYDYLDDSEVEALEQLENNNAVNDFVQLDKQRQTLELYIKNLPTLRQQKETLVRSNQKGNQELIDEYERKQARVKELKAQEAKGKEEMRRLTNRINSIDVQMQQEPDPKYDTLVKLGPFFGKVTDELLKQKRSLIENEMRRQLNRMLVSYKDHIGRVEISSTMDDFNIRMFHTSGNEISLDNLNAASKQIFIQVLLMVLRNLGDYNPPVMIDTVMGVLDDESRDVMMEEYFPKLAEQTILLCTTSEVRKEGKDSDYEKLKAYISKTYTLVRDVEHQNTHVEEGYFGLKLEND